MGSRPKRVDGELRGCVGPLPTGVDFVSVSHPKVGLGDLEGGLWAGGKAHTWLSRPSPPGLDPEESRNLR